MLPGYKEWFEHEIISLAGSQLKTDINVTADLYWKYSAWIGGSMIASLSTFEDMCVKGIEYTDANPGDKQNIVLQKVF